MKITLIACIFLMVFSNIKIYSFQMNNEEINAQNLYLEAVYQGGEKRIEKAEKAYLELLKNGEHPLNYKFRLASLSAMKAKYAFWPHEKMGFVNESIRQFDRLEHEIKKKNDDVLTYEFYMYRGRTYIHLPSFLNKKNLAMEDMKKAAVLSEQLPISPKELGPFYLEYAELLKKEGLDNESKKYARKSLKQSLSESEKMKAERLLE